MYGSSSVVLYTEGTLCHSIYALLTKVRVNVVEITFQHKVQLNRKERVVEHTQNVVLEERCFHFRMLGFDESCYV